MLEIIEMAIIVVVTLFVSYFLYGAEHEKTDQPLTENSAANSHEVDRYFLEQIHLGEALIGQQQLASSVEHFVNAAIVCGQQTRLLGVYQYMLPAQVYTMVVSKLSNKLPAAYNALQELTQQRSTIAVARAGDDSTC